MRPSCVTTATVSGMNAVKEPFIKIYLLEKIQLSSTKCLYFL